ncbi:MAG: hypothetical protein ACRDHP_05915 [Ktedonobacterales bacterium]
MAQPVVYPAPTCTECGLESSGRCPTCHHSLCLDHFGFDDHQPCANYHAEHADDYRCYVCGAPVRPQQWSTAVFAHYIDSSRCAGCHRYVCDTEHTRYRTESVYLARDGLRSHRYHTMRRYCSLCSPLRRLGGLLGASRVLVAFGVVAATAFIVLHR